MGRVGRTARDGHLDPGERSCRPCPSAPPWQMGMMVPERQGGGRQPSRASAAQSSLTISASQILEKHLPKYPGTLPVLRGGAVLGVCGGAARPLQTTRALRPSSFGCRSPGGRVAPPPFTFWILSLGLLVCHMKPKEWVLICANLPAGRGGLSSDSSGCLGLSRLCRRADWPQALKTTCAREGLHWATQGDQPAKVDEETGCLWSTSL